MKSKGTAKTILFIDENKDIVQTVKANLDLGGISICEILRRKFNFPIIMLTARDSLSSQTRC